MESEIAAIAQSAHHFLFVAVPVESWNDALSPWEAPAVWGKQGFSGKAGDTLRFLTEQVLSLIHILRLYRGGVEVLDQQKLQEIARGQ